MMEKGVEEHIMEAAKDLIREINSSLKKKVNQIVWYLFANFSVKYKDLINIKATYTHYNRRKIDNVKCVFLLNGNSWQYIQLIILHSKKI